MRRTKSGASLAAAAALLVVLTACSTDDSLDDPSRAGRRRGHRAPEQEWFVQADFDEQDAQRDATFEGDPAQPWLQYIDGEMTDTAEFKSQRARRRSASPTPRSATRGARPAGSP